MLDPSDTSIPRAARIYDALLAGKDNYEADRTVAIELTRAAPELPAMVRAQRALMRRVVTLLVRDAGLRQLLDIGTGIPAPPNVHQIAQAVAPETRVVYVDRDPLVLAHARARLRSRRAGRTAFVEADVRDTPALLDPHTVGTVLDLDRPIGALLIGVLHHLRDEDDPWGAVHRLVTALPPGSFVVVAHPASDIEPDTVSELTRIAADHGIVTTPRSRADVVRLVEGLDLVEPGVVPLLDWRPDASPRRSRFEPELVVPAWVAVARTPTPLRLVR